MEKKANNPILEALAQRLRESLYDEQQGGSPDLSEDGQNWRYGGCRKIYLGVNEVQALMELAGLPALVPVISRGECRDCLHGHDVFGHPYPFIDDCEGCLRPLHQHFIPYTDLAEYAGIRKEDVFDIPVGWSIPACVERLRTGIEGRTYVFYAGQNNFVFRVSDGKRICRLKSLGKLHLTGDKRWSKE